VLPIHQRIYYSSRGAPSASQFNPAPYLATIEMGDNAGTAEASTKQNPKYSTSPCGCPRTMLHSYAPRHSVSHRLCQRQGHIKPPSGLGRPVHSTITVKYSFETGSTQVQELSRWHDLASGQYMHLSQLTLDWTNEFITILLSIET
jgi:hypothetical protein